MARLDDLARFEAARVARLATVRPEGTPHVVPITFAFEGEDLVTAIDHKPKTTQRLQRLANIQAQPAVSVLADEWAEDWKRLWWIRLDGTAAIRDRDGAAIAALVAKYRQYEKQPPQGPVIRISITDVRSWHGAG